MHKGKKYFKFNHSLAGIFPLIFLFIIMANISTKTMAVELDAQQLIIAADQAYKNNTMAQAIDLWQQSYSLLELAQDSNLNATQLILISLRLKLVLAYQQHGLIDKAVVLLDKNLLAIKRYSTDILSIQVLNQASDVMISLGKLLKAESYAKQAVLLLNRSNLAKNNQKLIANTFMQRANSATVLGDFSEAVDYYHQVITISKQAGLTRIHSKALVNQLFPLAQIYQQQPEKFITKIDHVSVFLEKSSISHRLKINALISVGVLAFQQIDVDAAIQREQFAIDRFTALSYKNLSLAFSLSKQLKNNKSSSVSSGYLAKLYAFQQRDKEALALAKLASSYAQQEAMPEYLYQWYALIAKLELKLGNKDRALQALEKSVATLAPIRNHLDIGMRSPISSFNTSVKTVYYLLADLLLKKAEETINLTERKALLFQARETIESLKIAELENYFQDDCVANLQASQKTLDQVAKGVMVLYPISLPDRLVLLVSSQYGIEQFSVNVTAEQLKQQILLFRKNLQSRPHNRFLYQATQLYQWLITPINQTLKSHHIDTLIIVADGLLRTIPFSTLYNGKQFLIEEVALVSAPGIKLIDPKPLQWQGSDILLAGLSHPVQNFSALPGVPKELDKIELLVGGEKILDQGYTLQALQQKLESKSYSVVHLATHAQFTGQHKNDFLLTYNDKLTINKLKDLIGFGRFRDQPIELLTLSACQTALGDEKAALGLAGVAIKAGARSVLATLWFVDDEATSLAVTDFYQQLSADKKLSKAKALQLVQKKLIAQPRYWHPSYWAAFLLIGNWL